MSELLLFIVIYALYAATVCFLFVMLFIREFRRWWLRGATFAFGLIALGLPFWLANGTLGHPDPWPPPGRYDVLGWDVDEGGSAIYVFAMQPGGSEPYHLRVPFELGTALKLQEVAQETSIYKQITIDVRPESTEHGPNYAFNIERVFKIEELR